MTKHFSPVLKAASAFQGTAVHDRDERMIVKDCFLAVMLGSYS